MLINFELSLQGLLAAIIVYVNPTMLTTPLSNSLSSCSHSTATGKASTEGAHKTVNGYMAFILFSVAGLACERSTPCGPLGKCTRAHWVSFIHNSHPLPRLDELHVGAPVCWRVNVASGPCSSLRTPGLSHRCTRGAVSRILPV